MMRPQFPRLHARPDQPAEADRRKQLQVEVFLPDLVGDGLERHGARGAGIVDEDVDPAKILHDLVVGRGNIGSFGDVANVIVNLMPVLGELLPRRLQVLRAARKDRDVRAGPGKPARHREPNALAAAGDDGDAIFHRDFHFLFLRWSVIRKSGHRFSEKIMLKQKDRAR